MTLDTELKQSATDIPNRHIYHFSKRVFDITVSILLLIITIPVFFAISIAIKLESRGPVIFKQSRIGKHGKPFTIYKFRSMYVDAPTKPSCDFKEYKLHVTKVGNFLRRSSLDELPQLINIIKGEMSIIGPRPVIAVETDLILLRRESGAEILTPGLTGLAQVNGRTDISNFEKAEFDKKYLHNQSLLLDIQILYKTLFTCLDFTKNKKVK